ncbi:MULTISPECIES: FAD-dependent oxidoreductase [Gammaproteobacteria]|uniref:FAD-dependent oxidoreductase n=1 Tax=Gammaproteobacteria TaxID=1236 RepID=UPI000DD0A6D9|nr:MULTISPECIES: FAD-dependent oxidoreductase [Gammaproteobacteria]RTE85525.1 FAD-dependent oxidoreductase [Aliidiomarina sp. B3213]TCZ89495.1 FAD-dependent oxidoreductase [Lysobacter sp. N42]
MGLTKTQVIVVGGGMVGVSLALALASKGKKVALLERATEPKAMPDQPTLRVSALNEASQTWLEQLGVWSLLPPEKLGYFQRMQVWDDSSGADIQFSAASVDKPNLGCIVENAVIEAALWQKAEALGVQLETGVVIEQIEESEDDVHVQSEDGRHFLGQLLVAADGGKSQVRATMNVETSFRDYEQLGVVTTLTTEYPHEGSARQMFLQGGPLALLPMANPNEVSIVWSLPTLEAKALLEQEPQAFDQAVTAAAGGRLGLLKQAMKPAAFPLKMQYAEQWVKGRMVLAGDAAHTIHPLAGQGANLGLGDAWYLAEQLLTLGSLNGAWDAAKLQKSLRHYERARKTAAVKQIATMEGFHRLFTEQHPAVRFIRSLGLSATQRLDKVKAFFLKQANEF